VYLWLDYLVMGTAAFTVVVAAGSIIGLRRMLGQLSKSRRATFALYESAVLVAAWGYLAVVPLRVSCSIQSRSAWSILPALPSIALAPLLLELRKRMRRTGAVQEQDGARSISEARWWAWLGVLVLAVFVFMNVMIGLFLHNEQLLRSWTCTTPMAMPTGCSTSYRTGRILSSRMTWMGTRSTSSSRQERRTWRTTAGIW